MRRALTLCLALISLTAFAVLALAQSTTKPADPLPSWNEGAAKKAIIDFVARVTRQGPDFVAPAERIATFDNDGTLWSEQPVYFQFQFALDRVKALGPQHPEWKTQEPFKHVLAGDMRSLLAGGEKSLMTVMATAHSGMTTEEFQKIVQDWFASAKHPKTGRPYDQMIYQPMLEVLAYLRATGFKTFVVSGGGVEFMRAFAERAYGIPPEQVVGSQGKLKYELRDGKPTLVKLPEVQFVDDKEGKAVGIQTFIGRRPIAAFGNSDGDLQMLQWTTAGSGARLGLIVHHTDAEREWAYDRTSHIGKLDKALDEGSAKGWTIIDMKKDWKRIYPEPRQARSASVALTENDADRETVVEVGQKLVIDLSGNPSTGYGWTLVESPDPTVLNTLGHGYAPVAGGAIGSLGTHSWSFQAAGAGQQKLQFEYRRPWEGGAPPAKAVSYTITVR